MSNPRDKAVLNALFNPLLPLNDFEDDDEALKDADVAQETPEEQEAKKLEAVGVKLAEAKQLEQALEVRISSWKNAFRYFTGV